MHLAYLDESILPGEIAIVGAVVIPSGNFGWAERRLYHAHDEMYFGNSRDSVGIQIADLCTYFMQRRLMKRDLSLRDDADQFFEIFSGKAICAKPEPEWTTYRELFLEHRT